MLFIGFLLFLVAAPRNAASLSCFTCSNIDNLETCQTTTKCGSTQSCFTRSQMIGRALTFSMGCIDNEKCGNIPVYDSMSGRMSTDQTVEQCYECCGNDKCNNKLCKHKEPPPCVDTDDDCAYWNEKVGVCENIHVAKDVCRKFCKLCSLVDGKWADWSPWSSCDVTCGHGEHTRIRTCTDPAPAYRGLDCKGNNTDTKPCVRQLCPVHGGWTEWSDWGTCPVTCGIGIQKRHRTCTNPSPLIYGDHCFGDAMDVKICTQGICDTSNGGWSNWDKWVSCSASCDGGIRTRSRSCTNPQPALQGRSCVGDPIQVEECNKNACSSETTVAFHAYEVTDISPARNKTMVFSEVLLNQGNSYNSSTGVFAAPRNGTYTFRAQLCVTSSRYMHFDIMVEGTSYSAVYGYSYPYCECPSVEAIVALKTGEKVSVNWGITWSYTSASVICQNSIYVKNYFSGNLISA